MQQSKEACLNFLRSIPNAEHLADDLEDICKQTRSISFLCYDIHLLRKVNRAYGRAVGDALLAEVAEWTLDFPDSLLYRIEGDQFCLMFRDVDVATVQGYAAKMEARFGEVWKLCVDGREYDVFVLASIAVLADLYCDYRAELLELLEQALEISKKERQITLFTAESDRLTREHVRLQMELKGCVLSGMRGFHLAFQPLADPATGTWRGLEALCRWTGPGIGAVPPNIFIGEAEEMGLIHQLGVWVLDKALETCKALELDRIDHFFVSVNVSALQMNRRDFVESVLEALEKHRYPAGKLLLEITESTQFIFTDATLSSMAFLREKGVMFALDDFGSGFSSFSNLKNLPVDMLKTDREFIDNIENDNYLQYFYFIMSETAHANGMTLIAEGVETQEQLQSVVKNGADLIQGYLFGRPMSADAIARLRDSFTIPLPEFKGWMADMRNFKQWINSQNAYKITPSLFGLQSKCIRYILDEEDIEDAVDKILEAVGAHFKVNRVYVFMREGGTVFSEKYEWCAEGVESQKHLFQKIDGRSDGFYEILRENEVVIATNEEQLPANLRQRLEEGKRQGAVQSIVSMPMKQRGETLGFVGYDHSSERDWMPEELIIQHNLCLLCLIVLAENKKNAIRPTQQ